MFTYSCSKSWAQETAENFLSDLCDIYEPTISVGTQGGQKLTYATAYMGVACFVGKSASGGSQAVENMLSGKNTNRDTWMVRLSSDQTISPQARIVVTSLSNRTFEVKSINDGSNSIVKACKCVEIDRA
jgi:hypothetical protein